MTKTYPCGCAATGGEGLPDYCPRHGASIPQKKPDRIWVTECLFKKNGFPSLGTFGNSIGSVVIVPLATWTRLCEEIPELGRHQFEVGAQHD